MSCRRFFNILVGRNVVHQTAAAAAGRPVGGLCGSPAGAAGLTGWAQVKAGRKVSPANKAALDVWYVKHASLTLDLAILLQTARMVILGERINDVAIRHAWHDLQRAGICASNKWEKGGSTRTSLPRPGSARRRRRLSQREGHCR